MLAKMLQVRAKPARLLMQTECSSWVALALGRLTQCASVACSRTAVIAVHCGPAEPAETAVQGQASRDGRKRA